MCDHGFSQISGRLSLSLFLRRDRDFAKRTSSSGAHAGTLVSGPDNLGVRVLGVVRRDVASAAAAVRDFWGSHCGFSEAVSLFFMFARRKKQT